MTVSEDSLPIHNASITTARLYLRPVQMSDAKDMHDIRSDWECAKWALSPPPKALEETEQWLQEKVLSNAEQVANFAIELLDPVKESRGEQRKVIGMVGSVRVAELGYALNRQYHGLGYASEAVQAFMKLFWELVPRPTQNITNGLPQHQADEMAAPLPTAATAETDPVETLLGSGKAQAAEPEQKQVRLKDGWDFIEGIVDPENIASAKVLVKSGFTLWRCTKDDFKSVNLGLRGTAIYRLARPGTELGQPPGPFEINMDEKLGIRAP